MLSAIVLFALTASLWLGPSHGDSHASLRRIDLAELVSNSETVVCGEVVDTRCYRGRYLDYGEIIFTDVTIRVTRLIAGALATDTVTIQVPGGTLDGLVLECADVPRYRQGEKVLVFLRQYNGRRWNTGWAHGKYTLEERRDSRGQRVEETIVHGQPGRPVFRKRELEALRQEIMFLRQRSSSR